jgi:hypothetical protein
MFFMKRKSHTCVFGSGSFGMGTMIWDREEVRIRIAQLWRVGKDISYTGVLEEHPLLLFAGVNYHRNWACAVTSAGIDYEKVRRQEVWSKRRIRRELQALHRKGEDLSYNVFERNHRKLFHAAVYHFGAWQNALSSIGVDYEKIRKLKRWSRQKVRDRIRNLSKKGVDLSYRAMFRQGRGAVVSMGLFYYGAWAAAVESAGLDYGSIRKKPGQTPVKHFVGRKAKKFHGAGVA